MIDHLDEDGRIVSSKARAQLHRHDTNWPDFLQHALGAAVMGGEFRHTCGDAVKRIEMHWDKSNSNWVNLKVIELEGTFWVKHKFGGVECTAFFCGFIQPEHNEGQHDINRSVKAFFKNSRAGELYPCCQGYAYLRGWKNWEDVPSVKENVEEEE